MSAQLLGQENGVNNYSYLKDFAERYIQRHRGELPVVISRPVLVTATCKEPFVGWIDTVSAAGLIGYPLMLGIVKNWFWPLDFTFDVIPVDIVSNAILVSIVHAGTSPTPELSVMALAASGANIITAVKYFESQADYLKFNPDSKAVGDPKFKMHTNIYQQKLYDFFDFDLKLEFAQKIS